MKRAVSISIGSSKRDKAVVIELLGEQISLERIGTDGDMDKAARLYGELDGKVDAFGVGGAVLGLMVEDKWYTLNSVQKLIKYVKKTPVVDGTGLKSTLESRVAHILERELGSQVNPKRAFVMSAVDRFGTAQSFWNAGYDLVLGDLMTALGLNIPLRTRKALKQMARTLIPIMSNIPFEWLYPVGEAQEHRTPKFSPYFEWATVIAGDCHYVWKYMPDRLEGKVIVTNTTTVEDRAFFKLAGVKYLMTTTPVLDGRSFGTNMMEAAIIAALGRKEPVDYAHPGDYFEQMSKLVDQLKFNPTVQEL
jgi:hypothetical protein